MDNQNEEPFNLYSIIEYVKENYIGLLMLIFAFLIIYIVDNINQYNNMLFSLPTPGSISVPKILQKNKKNKKN